MKLLIGLLGFIITALISYGFYTGNCIEISMLVLFIGGFISGITAKKVRLKRVFYLFERREVNDEY